MGFRENINKIDSILKSKYSVKINEKNDTKIGNYIELTINDGDIVLEAMIPKVSLENNDFTWFYKSNPLDNNSFLIERNSNIGNFGHIVEDIFEEGRFDSDYLKRFNKKWQ